MDDENENEDLAIVLRIVEASGLSVRKEPIVIAATLVGNTLETDAATPSDLTTIFNNNLIWTASKVAIKRMKEQNKPIKLECFLISPSNSNLRENIGFVLVQMRSIPFWNLRKNGLMKPHWYKLMGVESKWKSQKPELLLSVSITQKESITDDQVYEDVKKHIQMEEELFGIGQIDPLCDMLTSQKGIIVKLAEEGFIQVGQNADQRFTVEIILKFISYLQLRESTGLNEKFEISYNLLGTRSENSKLLRDESGKYLINEKITMRFRSSLDDLKAYFMKIFYIPVDVLYDDEVIGRTRLEFGESLLPLPSSIKEFLAVFGSKNNTYSFEDYGLIVLASNSEDTNSKIHFSFSLKYDNKSVDIPQLELPDKPKQMELVKSYIGPDDKVLSTNSLVESNENISTHANNDKVDDQIEAQQTNRQSEIKSIPDDSPMFHEKLDSARSIPRTFSYNLTIKDSNFNRRPHPGIWQFSLHHSKADSPYVIKNLNINEISSPNVNFNNLRLNLCFSTQTEYLIDIIKSKPCIFTLKGPKGLHATAELDNENILAQEKITGIILLENEYSEQVGMAHVHVEIEDLGINFNAHNSVIGGSNRKNRDTAQNLLNEDLAYKMIEELEDWKIKQQEEFISELKRHEIEHLAHLSNEWQRRRVEQETKLMKKMEHCNLLTKALEEAQIALKERNNAELVREQSLLKAKMDMEKCYEKKLATLRERIRILEEDVGSQRKFDENRVKELHESSTRLTSENEKLKERIRCLETTRQQKNEAAISKEEIVSLYRHIESLTNKLESVQKSKMFYKEKWARLVREFHKLKWENDKHDDCECNQTDQLSCLKDMINSARRDFGADRETLKEIRALLEQPQLSPSKSHK